MQGKDIWKVYKALLFLGAGSVIHAVADNQDFRRYGGLRSFLPLTYSVMLIASLSLVAFPFMTGFYSKDFILESAFGQYYFSSTVVYIIATIGAMFTTLYSVKVLYLTFLTNPNGPLINYKQAHEGDIFMSLPLIILAVFSIFFGFVTKDMFIGLGSGFFADNALFIHPTHEIMLDTEFGVPTVFKLLPLLFTIVISFIFIVLTEYLSSVLIYFKLSRLGYNIFGFFNQRFLIELFYNKYITGVILKLGGVSTKIIDKGAVEYLGPYGLEKGLSKISYNIGYLNTGVITSYALYITTGLIFYTLFSFYLNTVIIILGIIISLSYNLNYSYTYKPQGFTLLYKSGITYNIKVYTLIIIVVIILTFLNQEYILCHSPDFTVEEYQKMLACKHESGYTKISPTKFQGLATPLCDNLLEGSTYNRRLVYHQAYSGALEPYYKCNACPAHLCEPCYVANLCLFLCKRRIVNSFNLGLFNVRHILDKHPTFFSVIIHVVLFIVMFFIVLYMQPVAHCSSSDAANEAWKNALEGNGPVIDKVPREPSGYRYYITGQFESLRMFWAINMESLGANYASSPLPLDDHAKYGVTPPHPEVIRKLCECKASLVDATQSCRFCSQAPIDKIKIFGGDM